METTSTKKNESFVKIFNYLYQIEELNYNEITILCLIKSFLDDKKEFYMTNEQIIDFYNGKFIKISQLKLIIKSLIEKDYITTETSKKKYPNSKWGNRRYITLGSKLDNNITSTNKEVKLDQIKEDNVEDDTIYQNNNIFQPEEDFTSNNEEVVNNLKELFQDNPWSSIDDIYIKLARYVGKDKLSQYQLETIIKRWWKNGGSDNELINNNYQKSEKVIIQLIDIIDSEIDKINSNSGLLERLGFTEEELLNNY
jgi:hypothetical protein